MSESELEGYCIDKLKILISEWLLLTGYSSLHDFRRTEDGTDWAIPDGEYIDCDCCWRYRWGRRNGPTSHTRMTPDVISVSPTTTAFAPFPDHRRYEQMMYFNGPWVLEETLLRIFLPQFLIFVIFIVYIGLGAVVFRQLDEKIGNETFTEVVLFCFTTLSTIGYGNISPTTTEARCFCLVYSTLGVPLCLVVIGNLSKHLTKAFWMIRICFGGNIRRPMGDATLPLKIVLILYFVIYMFGCLIYPEDENPKQFTLRNLYFSVVSFATVGFGDEYPTPRMWGKMIPMFLYLIFGVVLSGMLFNVLHDRMKKIHKIGTRVKGASDVTVWFGSKEMKVSKLLQIVAKEFDAKPRQIHEMLHGLDELLEQEVERRENIVASTLSLNR